MSLRMIWSADDQTAMNGSLYSRIHGSCSMMTGLKRPPSTATRSGMAASSFRFSTPRAGTERLSRVTSFNGRPPSTPPAALISSIAASAPISMACADELRSTPNSASTPIHTGALEDACVCACTCACTCACAGVCAGVCAGDCACTNTGSRQASIAASPMSATLSCSFDDRISAVMFRMRDMFQANNSCTKRILAERIHDGRPLRSRKFP